MVLVNLVAHFLNIQHVKEALLRATTKWKQNAASNWPVIGYVIPLFSTKFIVNLAGFLKIPVGV